MVYIPQSGESMSEKSNDDAQAPKPRIITDFGIVANCINIYNTGVNNTITVFDSGSTLPRREKRTRLTNMRLQLERRNRLTNMRLQLESPLLKKKKK